MGNSASSSGRSVQDETVDLGFLYPQGVYSGSRDWNEAVVGQLICDRKLAPFYRPLEDYDPSWDEDQILAARKELPAADSSHSETPARNDVPSASSKLGHNKRPSTAREVPRYAEAAIYRNAVECPICFLYYPPNINHSRCCDQAICTECFVQIKRSEPTVTHLVSDPACCPYCVQEHFGVVYTPPPWRTGIGSEGSTSPMWPDSQHSLESVTPDLGKQKRRKSLGHDSAEVVTTDQIRPDWETKLAAVRAAAARRANRRIIMRQVGDRLIPVGITSGRIHPLPPEAGASGEGGEGNGGGRRSRRRQQQQQELNSLLGHMGLGGQDLEELMVMEAMRLSLLEHEEQQRRQQREAANSGEGSNAPAPAPAEDASAATNGASPSSSLSVTPTTGPSSTSNPPSPDQVSPSAPSSPITASPTIMTSPPQQSHVDPPTIAPQQTVSHDANNAVGSSSDADWRRREHLPPLPPLAPLIPDNASPVSTHSADHTHEETLADRKNAGSVSVSANETSGDMDPFEDPTPEVPSGSA